MISLHSDGRIEWLEQRLHGPQVKNTSHLPLTENFGDLCPLRQNRKKFKQRTGLTAPSRTCLSGLSSAVAPSCPTWFITLRHTRCHFPPLVPRPWHSLWLDTLPRLPHVQALTYPSGLSSCTPCRGRLPWPPAGPGAPLPWHYRPSRAQANSGLSVLNLVVWGHSRGTAQRF